MNSLSAERGNLPVLAETPAPVAAGGMAELRRAHRLAIVGQLLPAIAHELGTPLGIVLARARIMEAQGLSPADQIRSGDIIAAQVDRMSRAIRRLIQFSDHPHALNEWPRRRGPVRLRAMVENVIEMLRPLAHRRQILLELERDSEVAASGDPALLEQALVHLLLELIEAGNAPGELRLEITRGHAIPPAGVAARPAEYARITVQMPPNAMMSRAWRTLVTRLTICQGIVREQGGWMALLSPAPPPPGVTVYLPVCAS